MNEGKMGEDWHQRHVSDKLQRAREARATSLMQIGTELMNSYNRGKSDPGEMATLGGDTAEGFAFHIERSGVAYTVTITRDWG